MFESEIQDNKNKNNVVCKYCNSRILNTMTGTHMTVEKNLPLMTQKSSSAATECEDLLDFWLVEDMFDFENVGFTLTLDGTKYLSCADCEMGPIGYHDINTKKSYVALARVKHEGTLQSTS